MEGKTKSIYYCSDISDAYNPFSELSPKPEFSDIDKEYDS